MSSAWAGSDGRLGPAAAFYASKYGWKILPVHGIGKDGKCTCAKTHVDSKDIGKHPAINNWNSQATDDVEQIATWWGTNPDYNVGVFAKESGFLVIDVDPRSGGNESFITLENRAEGALPPTVEAITGVWDDKGKPARGRHLIYRCSPDEKFIGNFKSEGLGGIDVKHNGYILLTPSRHFSGVTYEWKPGHAPWEMEIADAPEELLNAVRPKKKTRGVGVYGQADWSWMGDLEFAGEKINVEKIMQEGIDEGSRAIDVYALACALANKYGTDDANRTYIETLMIRFNAEMVRPPMELEGQNSLLMHVHRAIDFVANNPKIDLGWGGLSDWVKNEGTEWALKNQEDQASSKKELDVITIVDKDSGGPQATYNLGDQIRELASKGLSATEASGGGNINIPNDVDAVNEEDGGRIGYRTLTDTGNGRRMIDAFSSVIRYTESLGWFYWDGNHWRHDVEQLKIKELSKKVSPMIAGEVMNYGAGDDSKKQELVSWAKQAKSNTRISNMIVSSHSDERITSVVDQWDNNQHFLGAANGIIDLKTGELLKGRPDLYMTKNTPVSYTPGLKNVRWTEFLNFVTGGDEEYQRWLQKAVGYTLTGLVEQDVLFLVYGPPGSGKNTFVETIVNSLGTKEYAFSLDSQVLASNDGRSNSTDEYYMAELRGRRMVWVDELPDGERMKENQIKKMTGSQELQGRSPGERPFTFKSQGKLWITTNHKPIITDDAMWRRLRPIPLLNIPDKPDSSLKPYLSDPDGGLPAVLSWAVEGAIRYLNSSDSDPLGTCSVVDEAAKVYRQNEDRIGIFLDEETKAAEGVTLRLKDLFMTYKFWSEDRGERPMTQIAFHRKLGDRGLKIIGAGSKAEIKDMTKALSAVSSSSEVTWSNLV
tara:strand:- start:413 stop:3049 length:2637 start_codon:yes stop_codon:yes gene_type:complete